MRFLPIPIRRHNQMLDLLEHIEQLKSSDLKIEELCLRGVPYGCPATDFPVQLVTEVTMAPIVKAMSWSKESGATYRDAEGRELSNSAVVENAMNCGGVVHLREKVSFRFEGGRVVGFALYGTALDHFLYIKSYARFVEEFGTPDAVSVKEAFGDLMGYTHYYARSDKFVEWDEMGTKLVVVNFGMKRDGASDA